MVAVGVNDDGESIVFSSGSQHRGVCARTVLALG
jgi:hypothetical protein